MLCVVRPSLARNVVRFVGVCFIWPCSFINLGSNSITGLNPFLCPVGAFKVTSTGCIPCGPGRWGDSTVLTSHTCSGECTAGYSCPAGSTTATPSSSICPTGRYSLASAGTCTSCPAGKFGNTQGLSVATCSGNCAAGYACPAASTTANPPAAMCASGRYAAAGATSCSDCLAGQFSTAPAGTSMCPVFRFPRSQKHPDECALV
jgi:hypothetical protein